MTDPLSMLVPLRTFPGWPNVESPSVAFWLLLLIGIPLAVGVVVTLIGMGPTLVRRARGEKISGTESQWLGEGVAPKAVTAGDNEEKGTSGGASERW